MVSPVGELDEPNPVLRLATREGKLSWRYLPRSGFPQEKFSLQVYQSALTKFVWSRWLDIGLDPFLRVYGLLIVSALKHAEKELGQYLVNNSLTIHQNQGHVSGFGYYLKFGKNTPLTPMRRIFTSLLGI